MKRIIIFVCYLISFQVWATIDSYQFSSPEAEALYNQLTDEIRCPKCQNQNVAESDSDLSQDIKDKIYEMVEQGKSRQEILDYMIERYGYFVHYQPPIKKSTVVMWYGPFIFLFIAITVVVIWLRKYNREAASEPYGLTKEQQARMQVLLKENKDS